MLPTIDLHTALLATHLLGLALGLGGALMLDLFTVRFFVRKPITVASVDAFIQLSALVAIGLVLLWVSGLGLLTGAMLADPDSLVEPRIWAKLTIVGLLTCNGLYLHRRVFPRVARQVGHRLFDRMDRRERDVLASSGAISSVSWIFPMLFACIERGDSQANTLHGFAAYFGAYAVCVLLGAMVARALATRWAHAGRLHDQAVPLHMPASQQQVA